MFNICVFDSTVPPVLEVLGVFVDRLRPSGPNFQHNLSDILTKPMNKSVFQRLRDSAGIRCVSPNRARMINSVSFLVIILATAHGFFKYEDCDENYRSKAMCCTISEQSKKFFLCHCVSEFTCDYLASPTVVCLNPKAAPSGAEAIWDDYVNRNSSTTTTPAPPHPTKPPSPAKRSALRMSLLAGALAAVAIITFFTARVVKRRCTRNGYSALGHSPDSPYQETVEDNVTDS